MRPGSKPLVLGLDAGGTSTCAVLADPDGVVLGRARAGGGNPNSHPPEQAATRIGEAVRTVLGEREAATVRAVVLGMAGSSLLTDPAVSALFDRAWSMLGLHCPVRIADDAEIAFAAGTDRSEGTVLIAGTGAVASRIEGHRTAFTAGGHGWLLGDEGSAFWLGREAVRHTLHALESGQPHPDPLGESILGALLPGPYASGGTPDPLRQRLVAAVGTSAPVRLAELAPLVTDSARQGHEPAAEIVGRAANLLAGTALAARGDGAAVPVVLAGSLLEPANPVHEAVVRELGRRCDAPLYTADDPAAGAAWLAALDLLGSAEATRRGLHRCLVPNR